MVFENEPYHTPCLSLYEQFLEEKIVFTVPQFLFIDLANVLLQKKHLSSSDCLSLMYTLQQPQLTVDVLLQNEVEQIITLAEKHTLTVYDAQFLYLAHKKNLPLLSCDSELTMISGVLHPKDL